MMKKEEKEWADYRRQPGQAGLPIKAIRRFCCECFGFEDVNQQIKECSDYQCFLYPFRFGHYPDPEELRKEGREGFKGLFGRRKMSDEARRKRGFDVQSNTGIKNGDK